MDSTLLPMLHLAQIVELGMLELLLLQVLIYFINC